MQQNISSMNYNMHLPSTMTPRSSHSLTVLNFKHILKTPGTSLVAQWLRIRLPMQGTRFEPWSGKVPHATEQLSPCATTTKPVRHNY